MKEQQFSIDCFSKCPAFYLQQNFNISCVVCMNQNSLISLPSLFGMGGIFCKLLISLLRKLSSATILLFPTLNQFFYSCFFVLVINNMKPWLGHWFSQSGINQFFGNHHIYKHHTNYKTVKVLSIFQKLKGRKK